MLEVWNGSELVDQLDVTNQLVSGNNREMMAQYNVAIASGQISETVTIEEFESNFEHNDIIDDGRNHYYFKHQIIYEDYPEQKIDMHSSESLRLSLVVTCKDGYVWESY